MKIIAIDPGYERLGIAVIEKNTGERKERLLYSDCVITSAKLPHFERLGEIGKAISAVIEQFEPEAMAIETLFFAKNQKTALAVAEARGVAVYEAARQSLKVFEYMPNQIKVAVAGHGAADKKQMMSMVPKLIAIEKPIKHDDEYDAIAVGLTCFAIERFHKYAFIHSLVENLLQT